MISGGLVSRNGADVPRGAMSCTGRFASDRSPIAARFTDAQSFGVTPTSRQESENNERQIRSAV